VTRLLLICALLAGCVGPPSGARPLTGGELQAAHAATTAWVAAELDPLEPVCAEDLERWRVLVVDDPAEYLERSSYCRPGLCGGEQEWDRRQCPNGCAHVAQSSYADGVWPVAFAERRWPLTVVWHETNPVASVRHEAVHELQACTGRGYNGWAPHSDAEVWCAEGCPGRWSQ